MKKPGFGKKSLDTVTSVIGDDGMFLLNNMSFGANMHQTVGESVYLSS